MNTPNTEPTKSSIPTAARLADARLKQWHQQGEALLTIENLRGWMNAAGLALFVPRPQIASPAPTLVEAVLGAPTPNPTFEQTAEARSLLARLVAEGLAVPLNLMGAGSGDTPDFVASTAVFSYVFTLRGDKAWKQPPSTSGATKVSNLALAIHEALTRRGALSAYDLTTEVGKEVTEAAVVRALGELWTHMRVLPLTQPDGAATLWELTSTRFTKQIKAGANAGQPSALSALISLYLGQAVVATEDEIESFLSPLAPRSRVRDVVHALLSARQLETVAVEGRTMLYVAGALPSFLVPETVVPAVDAPSDEVIAVEVNEAEAEGAAEGEEQPRITKYVPKPRKVGTGYLAKAKPSKFAAKPGPFERGAKPRFEGAKPERERRPFQKAGSGGFDKPWNEEKPKKFAGRRTSEPVEGGEARASRGAERGDRGKFGAKPTFRGKPAFGDKPAFRRKPSFGEGRPPRGEFKPRREGEGGDARGPRKTFSKPGTFGRKREGFAARESGDRRPPRREFKPRDVQAGERRPGSRFDRGEGGGFAPRKPYPPRGAGFFSGKPRTSDGPAAGGPRERPDRAAGGEGVKRVYKKFDAPRDRPARPYNSDRPARSEGFGGGARKSGGDFAPRKFAGKPGAKTGGKPGGFAGKKAGGFGGKKSGGFGKKSDKPFAGKPASTFAKFAGNKKPWGKRPPARKFKPSEGESA